MTVILLLCAGLAFTLINFFVRSVWISLASLFCFLGLGIQTSTPEYLKIASFIVVAGLTLSIGLWGARKAKVLG